MKALLLSGGIDSTALAYWLRPTLAVTVNYGQAVAEAEIHAASAICGALNIPHRALRLDCGHLGGGCMVGKERVSVTATPEWWPYRNQLLVTITAMALVAEGLEEIWVGTVAGDDVHADGKQAFVDHLSRLLEIQEGAVRVRAPAIHMTSEKLLEQAQVPRSLLGWTFSCHVSRYPCGRCRGCIKHEEVLLGSAAQSPA